MQLSSINHRFWTRRVAWIAAPLVFALSVTAGVWPMWSRGQLGLPPDPGDGPDYDNIAVHLLAGRGYGMDFSDPEFRRPYIEANTSGQYDYLLQRTGRGFTTYKPPALPVVLCVTYVALGRQFTAIRIVNVVALACAATLIGWIVFHVAGPVPSMFGVASFVITETNSYWTRGVLTESLACLMVALLAATLVKCRPNPNAAKFAMVGAVFGASVLVRNIFYLWFPVLGLFVFFGGRIAGKPSFHLLRVFIAAALVIPLPWVIRNCALLGPTMPLGTQGLINIGAGYSDEALKYGGEWSGEWMDREVRQDESRNLQKGPLTSFEEERQAAENGRAELIAWIKSHPETIPKLIALKTYNSWRPRSVSEGALLLLATIGLVRWRQRWEGLVVVTLLAANTFAVALTYWYGAQFQVPIRPLVHAAAAIGGWTFLLWLVGDRITLLGSPVSWPGDRWPSTSVPSSEAHGAR